MIFVMDFNRQPSFGTFWLTAVKENSPIHLVKENKRAITKSLYRGAHSYHYIGDIDLDIDGQIKRWHIRSNGGGINHSECLSPLNESNQPLPFLKRDPKFIGFENEYSVYEIKLHPFAMKYSVPEYTEVSLIDFLYDEKIISGKCKINYCYVTYTSTYYIDDGKPDQSIQPNIVFDYSTTQLEEMCVNKEWEFHSLLKPAHRLHHIPTYVNDINNVVIDDAYYLNGKMTPYDEWSVHNNNLETFL